MFIYNKPDVPGGGDGLDRFPTLKAAVSLMRNGFSSLRGSSAVATNGTLLKEVKKKDLDAVEVKAKRERLKEIKRLSSALLRLPQFKGLKPTKVFSTIRSMEYYIFLSDGRPNIMGDTKTETAAAKIAAHKARELVELKWLRGMYDRLLLGNVHFDAVSISADRSTPEQRERGRKRFEAAMKKANQKDVNRLATLLAYAGKHLE